MTTEMYGSIFFYTFLPFKPWVYPLVDCQWTQLSELSWVYSQNEICQDLINEPCLSFETQVSTMNTSAYSMVQSSSWWVNWFAASQEIPCISQNPKVHYSTHQHLQPVSILGQPNLVHIPTSHLLEIHSNIIHPSTPRSPQWSLSFRFPHQDPIHPPLLTHTCHMPSPSHRQIPVFHKIQGKIIPDSVQYDKIQEGSLNSIRVETGLRQ